MTAAVFRWPGSEMYYGFDVCDYLMGRAAARREPAVVPGTLWVNSLAVAAAGTAGTAGTAAGAKGKVAVRARGRVRVHVRCERTGDVGTGGCEGGVCRRRSRSLVGDAYGAIVIVVAKIRDGGGVEQEKYFVVVVVVVVHLVVYVDVMLLRFGAALGVADVRPGVSLAAAAPGRGDWTCCSYCQI